MSGAEAAPADAARRCAACGEENPARSRFCSSCGGRLEEASAPREERKLVSVLFVDLVGFTARSDRADPEDVRDALQLYHAEAKHRIEQYGGVLEKFIGDAVMAVFGAPVAHGDDAERAVRAGLRVLEGIDELNREHALDLAARAAVNTGEAVVAVDATHGDALATGDVVNTASRLQSAAPTGGLIVGAETYRATRHAILYQASEPVEVKGKAEAVRAWLAIEPSLDPQTGRSPLTPSSDALVSSSCSSRSGHGVCRSTGLISSPWWGLPGSESPGCVGSSRHS
jgi:class 3 adenylate cyclase